MSILVIESAAIDSDVLLYHEQINDDKSSRFHKVVFKDACAREHSHT